VRSHPPPAPGRVPSGHGRSADSGASSRSSYDRVERLAPDDERVRCAVAEPLAARRSQREQCPYQIEEETVDQAQQVADDSCAERQLLPVFTHDADPDHALAKRHPGRGLANDVVAEAECGEQQPDYVPAEIDSCVRVAVASLGVAAARKESHEDAEGAEDDEYVAQDSDEAARE